MKSFSKLLGSKGTPKTPRSFSKLGQATKLNSRSVLVLKNSLHKPASLLRNNNNSKQFSSVNRTPITHSFGKKIYNLRKSFASRSDQPFNAETQKQRESWDFAGQNQKMIDILMKKGLIQNASDAGKLDYRTFAAAVKEDSELKATVNNIKDNIEFLSYGEAWRRAETRDPVTVTITGAAGAIAYSAAFRVAAGDLLGPDQPVNLNLLEIEPGMQKLSGVVMEIKDCAFPLVRNITTTTDPKKAFEGADYGLLIGASPRTKGMERADLLKKNAAIFEVQGKAINETANKNIKVIVVGNPANTNALITSHYAPTIHPRQITAMTRLDHTRGLAQLSEKLGCLTTDIERFAVWGNHSPTMYPDVTHALLKGKPIKDLLDHKWIDQTFNPTVQQRGAAVINALGSSSAASAANAAITHVHDWVKGSDGAWLSMAVPSEGEYGITPGIWYSYPVVTSPFFGLGGTYEIVGNVPIDKYSAEKMEATHQELLKERDAIANMLK